ncbi:MAG: T9SS C-terminal target domain-containing protein [Bacteroidetes bacterium]|nr:MAG: T9SS C-terminal target domain-containing protein [Bacteroidota bacterium]REJ99773.1 MAG: T9SS C-terminal target domain-containing protein [Bacteroidota bacterium]REK34146.1 MAG: T9SS C-terminal target domain-containing protein [Bacteroidota bacterium]REK50476.1 MAG: T9SS C-terminal target domain-containing protein [Bacteroidota bacterium]
MPHKLHKMKKAFALMSLQVLFSLAMAIEPPAGMNLGLHRKVMLSNSADDMVSVLIQGNVACIRDVVERENGVFVVSAGDVASVKVPALSLPTILEKNCVRRIEAYPSYVKTLNDTMRMLCRVDEIHQGLTPLQESFLGDGVVIGYIDSGIDVDHDDFKDSLGNTRVAWLWDMTLPVGPNTPMPYGYGQEWNASEINLGMSSAHTGEAQFGHGNYVAGIGSGNGRATGNFKGVAPNTDIIVVSYDFNAADTVSRMAHAVSYIFNRANAMGKPCVINASLGEYYGSHDGRDLQSRFISNLIIQQPGRVVVAAAGNAGGIPFHVGNSTSAGDTTFTWFRYNSTFGGAYVQLFGDTLSMNDITFSIGADKISPNYEFRGATPYSTVASTLNNVVTRNVFNGPNRIGVVQTLATLNDDVYSLEVYVIPDSTAYNWRFSVTGNGSFDSWSFDWVSQNLPSSGDFPDIVKYHAPDTIQTMVSGIACLDNVITVGNYFNTDRHYDVNNVLQIAPADFPRQLAPNSSRGPTRDGRIKPDICAPGHHIISTGVLTSMPGLIAAQPHKVAQGGMHITGGGTSASAPVVAGIAALYLQQNPLAGWAEVKNAIVNCAVSDMYTWGPLPNNAWGHGKADAFGALTTCRITSVNQYSITENNIQIFPNPAKSKITITGSSLGDLINGKATLSDIHGRPLMTHAVEGKVLELDLSGIPKGFYFLRLSKEGRAGFIKKLVIQ